MPVPETLHLFYETRAGQVLANMILNGLVFHQHTLSLKSPDGTITWYRVANPHTGPFSGERGYVTFECQVIEPEVKGGAT